MTKISDNYDLIGILFQDDFKRFQAGEIINLSNNYLFKKDYINGGINYLLEENTNNNFNTILSEVYNENYISYNIKAIIGNNGVGKSTILSIIEKFYIPSNKIYLGPYNDNLNIKFTFKGKSINLDKMLSYLDLKISSGINKDILYIIKMKNNLNSKKIDTLHLTHSILLKENNYNSFIIEEKDESDENSKYRYFRDDLLLGALNVTENKNNIQRIAKIKFDYIEPIITEKNKKLFILKYFIILLILNNHDYSLNNLHITFFYQIFECYFNLGLLSKHEDYKYITFDEYIHGDFEKFLENNTEFTIQNFIGELFIIIDILEYNDRKSSNYLQILNNYYFFTIINNEELLNLLCRMILDLKLKNNRDFFEYFRINHNSRNKEDFIWKFEKEFNRHFNKPFYRENIYQFEDEFKRPFNSESILEYKYLFLDIFEREIRYFYDLFRNFEFYKNQGEFEIKYKRSFNDLYSNLLKNRNITKNSKIIELFNIYNEKIFKYFLDEIKLNYKKNDSLNDNSKYIEDDFFKIEGIINKHRNSNILGFIFNKLSYVKDMISFDIIINKSNGDYFYLSNFSSGEKQLISILNAINTHIENKLPNNRNLEINILLDEPEISLHIEWQRKFMFYLINGINNILKDKGEFKVNIIIATHSPFIISDLSKNDVIFLHRNNNITSIKDFETIKADSNIDLTDTFLGNIPELLRGGFFLEESVGELGKKYLNSVFEKIKIIKIKIQINKYGLELLNNSLNNEGKKILDSKLKILNNELKNKYKLEYVNVGYSVEELEKLNTEIEKLVDQLDKNIGDKFILDYMFLNNLKND